MRTLLFMIPYYSMTCSKVNNTSNDAKNFRNLCPFAISVFFIGMKKYVIAGTISYICLIFPILKFPIPILKYRRKYVLAYNKINIIPSLE